MSLQIVYGRAHGGKTQYILDAAQKLYKSSRPFVIVVPEQFTHEAEKRLISKIGPIHSGMSEVLSFDQICKKINNIYPNGKQQLSAIGKTLIISDILSDVSLEYYKSASDMNGFIDVCSDEISEFKKYMITPSDLLEVSENTSNKALSLKLKDLSDIYSAYENKLSTVFCDADDGLNILADNLLKYNPYSEYTFLFDEFSSFNTQERNIISILSNQVKDVIISFCADCSNNDKASLFKATLEGAEMISNACKERGAYVKPSIILPVTYYNCEELSFLEDNLYSNKVVRYSKPCGNIRIYNCENPYAEVINVATQVSSLVRERNVRYRDIIIICSDISEYGYIIKSVFDMYDIPYFIDDKTRILDHSIVNFVINILDVYINGYSGENVVNFLKSGCISADKDDISAADNFVTATSATKNTWLSDDRFFRSVNAFCEKDDQQREAVVSLRQKYILPLARLHDCVKGRNTIRYITEKLYEYLLEIEFDKRISEYIQWFKKDKNIYLAKQYEQVWKSLIEAFDMMVYIMGDKVVNLSEYRRFLYTAFGQQKTGIIPTSVDEVVIGDVKRSKSADVSYQFVLGAVEGSFPSAGEGGSLITDSEKIALSSMGINLSPDNNEKAYFDRFQLYCVLTHPSKALIISYPSSDSGFSAVRPAFVISQIKRIFPGITVRGGISDVADGIFYTRHTATEHLAHSALRLSSGEYTDPSWQDVYKYFIDNGLTYEIDKINEFMKHNKDVVQLSPEFSQKLYDRNFYSTISRLQKYNECRYKYYLEYLLCIKEKKTFGLQAFDIGSMIHDIIEQIFSEMNKSGKKLESVDRSYFEKEVESHLDRYVQMLFDSSGEISERDVFSVKRLKDSIVVSLLAVRGHIINSAFEPLGHEIVFDDNNIGCIELTLDNGKTVKITGKIDRADSFTNEKGTFVRVIDYKTGSKTFSFTNVFYGLDIQLLVYMNALVDKTANSHPAGALFFKIDNPIKSVTEKPDADEYPSLIAELTRMDGVVPSDEHILSAYAPLSVKSKNMLTSSQFRILGDYINTIIKNTAQSMYDGYINVNPYQHSSVSSCDYCSYKCICNFKDGENGNFRSLKSCRYPAVFKDMEAALPDSEVNEQ